MNLFEGRYFDGKSARAVPVRVIPTEASLDIILIQDAESGEERAIRWDYSLIRKNDVNNAWITVLKYGDFPYQTLETESKGFLDSVRAVAPTAPFLKSPYRVIFNAGTKGIIVGILILGMFIAATYWYLIPLIMETTAEHFPRNMEVQMGQKMKSAFLSGMEEDSLKTVLVNNFYKEMQYDGDYDIHITVVNSEVKNAMALPGGEIVIFSGILDKIHSAGELAALLGHETGHIEKRHSLKVLFRNMANYIIISAILQDVSGILAVIADNANSINQLSYSRELESESDQYGYSLMLKNRLDPVGMVKLFEHLKTEDHVGGKIPDFLLTHPKLESRIETVKGKISMEKKLDVRVNDSLEHYWKLIKQDADED